MGNKISKKIHKSLKKRIPKHLLETADVAYDVAEYMAENPRAYNGKVKAAASGAAPWNPEILEQEMNMLRISRIV